MSQQRDQIRLISLSDYVDHKKDYNLPTMNWMHWWDEPSTLFINSLDAITCPHWLVRFRENPWEKQNILGGMSGAYHGFGQKLGWRKVLAKKLPKTTNAVCWWQSWREKASNNCSGAEQTKPCYVNYAQKRKIERKWCYLIDFIIKWHVDHELYMTFW